MSEPAAAAAPEAKSGKPMATIGMIVVALAVGFGVGNKVIGPKVKPAAGAEAAPEEGGHGEAVPAVEAKIVHLDNLIVNPMGSMGTRYAIISVAIEVPTDEANATLTRLQVPLRDALLGILEKETLQSLGAPGAREALKLRVAEVAQKFVPKTKLIVYIPQFLIQ